MLQGKKPEHISKSSTKYKIAAFLAVMLLLSYVIVSINSAHGNKQSDEEKTYERIVQLKTKEMKAYYFEKLNLPIKEKDIKSEPDKAKWEQAVYLSKSINDLLPHGFMTKDDAFFVADTGGYRVIQAYPGKIFEQADIDEPTIILDVWVNTLSDYYILGYSNGLQIYHYNGRQFEKLDAEFSGLDNTKYVKAYFSDEKVVIVEPKNNIYYYDIKDLHNKLNTAFGLSFEEGCIRDTITGKQYKSNIFDSSTLYPLGKDINNNIYIVCNKENIEVHEQFLLKLDIQKDEAEVMKIEYNPIYYNSVRLSEDDSLYQMLFEDKTCKVKELRFMDMENSSANISEKVDGIIKGVPIKQDLLSISFIDIQTGYLSIAQSNNMNSEYKLLKTVDGGNNWNTVYNGMSLCGLKFFTELKGFAYNEETLFMTIDGGCNWEPVDFKGIKNIIQIHIVNEKLFFVATYDNLYRSTDGGTSWKNINIPQNQINSYTMSWVSKKEGYILYGYGGGCGFESKKLYYTVDEGKHWTLQASTFYSDNENGVAPLEAGGYIKNICFFHDGTGYLNTSRGNVSKTTDKGLTHKCLNLPSDVDCPHILDFINKNEGYMITGYSHANQLYRTTDGASSWKQVFPLEPKVGPLAFSSTTHGIGVVHFPDNESYISSTSDGGKTWTKLLNANGRCIKKIDTVEDGTILMLEESSYKSEYGAKLLRSKDGGHKWDIVKKLNSTSGTFSFINSDIGYVGSHNKEMYKTTDGGDTWISIPQQEEIWNTSFAYKDYGWGCAKGGILVYTSNCGQTWKPIHLNSIKVLSDIQLFDQDNYFLIGHTDGKYSILHSQDGGKNFKQIVFPQGGFNYIEIIDSKNIFAVANGKLYKSSDGGITFESVK